MMPGAFVVNTAQLLALPSHAVGGAAPEQVGSGDLSVLEGRFFLEVSRAADLSLTHSSVVTPWGARAVPILALPDCRLPP